MTENPEGTITTWLPSIGAIWEGIWGDAILQRLTWFCPQLRGETEPVYADWLRLHSEFPLLKYLGQSYLPHAFLRYFLGYPSQPMSTVGTVFSLVRTLTAYLYGGSLTTELALGLQFDRAQLCL